MRLTFCGRSAVYAFGLVLALSACQTGSRQPPTTQAPAPQPAEQAPPPEPDVVVNVPPELQGKTRAALLLPLSGQHAAVGRHLNNAAQLALFDLAGNNFALSVEDTQGTPAGARAAAERAVASGAQILLGPLFSGSVQSASTPALVSGINMLAFSSDSSVAQPGVWIMGLSPEGQIERAIEFATRQGLLSYSILAPNTAYGQLVANAARQEIQERGGSVINSITFTPGLGNYQGEVQSLAAAQGQAVILPAGGQDLLAIAPLMPFYNIDPEQTQYIGTMLWNDPGLGTEPALTGGWFAGPPPAAWEDFAQRYRQLYGETPPRIASISYDAVALAAVLARSPGSSGAAGINPYDDATLTSASGFQGLDGIFRFRQDGSTQRGLAVMELQPQRIDVIEIAPDSFQYLGS